MKPIYKLLSIEFDGSKFVTINLACAGDDAAQENLSFKIDATKCDAAAVQANVTFAVKDVLKLSTKKGWSVSEETA